MFFWKIIFDIVMNFYLCFCVCVFENVEGFGRMGKSVARAILRSKDALLMGINDPFINMNDMVKILLFIFH